MRIFIGNLNERADARDVEEFFKRYGQARGVTLRTGFGFVDIDDNRDAEDAMRDLDGRDLLGKRVRLEPARRDEGPRKHYYRDRSRRSPPDRHRYGGGQGRRFEGGRYGPPRRTPYRLLVNNLSTRCSWQDLKDMMRTVGEVTYAEAHEREKNTGLVCFERRADLEKALDKFQGKDFNGRKMELIDDSYLTKQSRSPSSRGSQEDRSPPPARKRPIKRSPSTASRSPGSSPKKRGRGEGRGEEESHRPPARRHRSPSSSSGNKRGGGGSPRSDRHEKKRRYKRSESSHTR